MSLIDKKQFTNAIKNIELKGSPAENNPFEKEQIANIQSDRSLKKKYAHWFVWILIMQLLIMNLIFIGVGLNLLKFEQLVLELYLGGTLAEVFGVVLVITNNLFPKK